MNRRSALAAAAAISLSITGIAAAAGATMHVFDAAEASPNLGKVSPVSTTTRPPAIEHRVLVVDDPAPAYLQLRQLTEPKDVAGRNSAGFNPARRDDVRLFAAVLDGDHIARGFRNRDIRSALFGPDAKSPASRSAAVGRLVKRLHVRSLVAKIPRTRRWRVTETGRHLLSLAVQLYRQRWPELLAA